MADPLHPERIAELRRIVDGFKRGAEMGWRATRIAFANELADFAERHAEALLAAAEENAQLRAEVERLRAQRDALVRAAEHWSKADAALCEDFARTGNHNDGIEPLLSLAKENDAAKAEVRDAIRAARDEKEQG